MIHVFFAIVITEPLNFLLSNTLVAITRVDGQILQYNNISWPKHDLIEYKRYDIGPCCRHCGSNIIPNRMVYIATR